VPRAAASAAAAASPPDSTASALREAAKRWALAAVAACMAETVTFPLDFTKTRLQLQNELGRTLTGEVATARMGMLRTAAHIYRTEGLLAMYTGLGAAALRQAVYGGIGVGLYAPMRKLVIGDEDPKHAALW
jgi:adenylyl- and sulfurtransferase ThiI